MNQLKEVKIAKPRSKPDQQSYQNGKVYQLTCLDPSVTDIYVGSTILVTLSKRFQHHKDSAKRNPDRKVYKFILNNGGFENWRVIIIEKFPCKSKIELIAREDYWMKHKNASLNSIPAYINEKDKKQLSIARSATYRNNHLDEARIRGKEYRSNNKDLVLQNKKEYYEKNKDHVISKSHNYYNDNKALISEKRKVMVHCDTCNCEIRKCDIVRHNKTPKHKSLLEQV